MGVRKNLHAIVLDKRDELIQQLGSLKRYVGRGEQTGAENVAYNEGINDAMKLVREIL